MENNLHTISLCEEDWKRVIHSLRNDAFWMKQQSNRAHEKEAEDYATLCWAESAILSDIADTIEYKL